MNAKIIPASATGVLTPWFPRYGDNAMFSYQIVAQLSGTTLDVEVLHKDLIDSGPGAALVGVGSPEWTATGAVYTAEFRGIKELVRFRLTTSLSGLGVYYRFLAPNWFNTAT